MEDQAGCAATEEPGRPATATQSPKSPVMWVSALDAAGAERSRSGSAPSIGRASSRTVARAQSGDRNVERTVTRVASDRAKPSAFLVVFHGVPVLPLGHAARDGDGGQDDVGDLDGRQAHGVRQ